MARAFTLTAGIGFLISNVAPLLVQAQGYVLFSTRVSGIVVGHVYGFEAPNVYKTGNTANETPSGTQTYAGALLTGAGFSAQLFATNGVALEAALVLVPGSTTTFRTGATLGGTPAPLALAVPSVPVGGSGTFQVRAWDNAGGTITSYNNAVIRGKSDVFTVTDMGDNVSILPANMENFRSFCLSSNLTYPIISAHPQSQTVVVASNATFSVAAVGLAPLHYQWRKNASPLSGATASVLTLNSVTVSDAGNYDVVVTNDYGSVTSSNAVLQVLPPSAPSISVNGRLAVDPVMVGSSGLISMSGGFPGGLVFYTLDGSDPSVASIFYAEPFTLTNSATIKAMSLSADFSQTAFAPAISLVVLPVYGLQVTVSGSGSVSLNPATGPYLSNSVVTLTAVAATNSIFDHWGGDLSGSVNPATLTMNGPRSVLAVFGPATYPLTIGTPGGGTVTANGQTISSNTYYATGSAVSLEGLASSGWSFLRWQGTTNSAVNPFNISMNQTQNVQAIFGTVVSSNIAGSGSIVMSATNPVPYGTVLTNTAVPAPGYFFLAWSGAVSGTNNPTSFVVTNATPAVGAFFSPTSTLSILKQPTNVVVVLGNSASFNVGATGTAPLTYQWRKAGTNINGATGTNYTIASTVTSDAGNYDVLVMNGVGSSLTSAVATLTLLLPPAIAQQPQSRLVVLGSNTTFSVVATGTPVLSYQWRKNGQIIGGAIATNYGISSVSTNDAGGYDVVVSNPYGAATSGVAVLTVVFPPSITTQPTNQTVASGSVLTLRVVAVGTEPLNYQWHHNGTNVTGETNSTFTRNPALTNDAGLYSAVVSNAYGVLTSQVATVTVYVPVLFTLHPASQVAPLRGTAVFDSLAYAFPAPYYQWQFNGEFIPEANGRSLVLTNIGTDQLGDYSVIAWNPYSIATSSVARLFMSPSIRGPFVGTTAVWGKGAILSVSAVGSGEISYQWFKDGVAIARGTNDTLSFPSVQLSDGGLYSVVVTSAFGSVTNAPALLVVNPAGISIGLYAGITIDGVAGYTYGIQYSTDLTDTNSWITLTNLTLTQPVEIWVDTTVTVNGGGAGRRFYRVVAP